MVGKWRDGQADSWTVTEINLGNFVRFSRKEVVHLDRIIRTSVKYRHFKGKEYLVLNIAKHSETLEDYVVYQALYGDMGIWIRPLSMFAEQVTHEGKLVYRFEEIE